ADRRPSSGMTALQRRGAGMPVTLTDLAVERIFGAVIQFADGVAVETLLVHLEDGAEQQDRRHLLDGEADCLRSRVEAAIAGRAVALLAAARKQLRGRGEIEAGHWPFNHESSPKASRPGGRPDRPVGGNRDTGPRHL